MLTGSKYALATYSNTEVLAVNQDKVQPGAKGPGSGFKVGRRLLGGDLALPCKPGSANCTNVWGRPLSNGDLALAFVNNGAANATVTCDAECWKLLLDGAPPAAKYTLRDLWSHADVAVVTTTPQAGFSFAATVTPNGGSRLFRARASSPK
eukprot:COSAG01_NODE_2111_length_8407_cov_2.098700_2_plen_151_part_00